LRKQDHGLEKQLEDNTTKALINTLEGSDPTLLKAFLENLAVDLKNYNRITYDLQVSGKESRPDAVIQADVPVLIESKLDSPLIIAQIEKHLHAIPRGYLICITPRDSDARIVKEISDKRLRFITWADIHRRFTQVPRGNQDPNTRFLIGQFLQYLEAINMGPFDGWHRKDFEAFLNLEDDPDRELRRRVKEKLDHYMKELKALLIQEGIFKDLQPDVLNVKADSAQVCAVLCKPPLQSKVQVPHFNFVVNSDRFEMAVQIEGKAAAKRMQRNILSQTERFLEIIKKLDEFDLVIRKRINPQGLPRGYYGVEHLRVKLGDDVERDDVEYLIRKLSKYPLFEIGCIKRFKRDEEHLRGPAFLKKSVEFLQQLQDYYEFSLLGD